MNHNILTLISKNYLQNVVEETIKEQMNITSFVSNEGDEDDPYDVFIMDINFCGIHNIIKYYDVYDRNIQEWEDFLDSMLNGESYNLCFNSINGYVGIRTDENYVEFCVEKCGSDGDGTINVKLDRKTNLPKLETAFNTWINHMKEKEEKN